MFSKNGLGNNWLNSRKIIADEKTLVPVSGLFTICHGPRSCNSTLSWVNVDPTTATPSPSTSLPTWSATEASSSVSSPPASSMPAALPLREKSEPSLCVRAKVFLSVSFCFQEKSILPRFFVPEWVRLESLIHEPFCVAAPCGGVAVGRIRFGADRAMGILGKEGMVRKHIFFLISLAVLSV